MMKRVLQIIDDGTTKQRVEFVAAAATVLGSVASLVWWLSGFLPEDYEGHKPDPVQPVLVNKIDSSNNMGESGGGVSFAEGDVNKEARLVENRPDMFEQRGNSQESVCGGNFRISIVPYYDYSLRPRKAGDFKSVEINIDGEASKRIESIDNSIVLADSCIISEIQVFEYAKDRFGVKAQIR